MKKIIIIFLITVSVCYSHAQISFITPKNNSVVNTEEITFTWNSNSNPNYYFQITTDKNFTSYQELISTNAFATIDTFEVNNTYFYRVKSENTNWSSVDSIIIFHPETLSNLELWLSADSGIILTDTQIESWTDNTSNTYSAYQSTDANKPTIQTSSLNNRPVVAFDGTDYLLIDSTLEIKSIFSIFNWSDDNTTFPVYNGLITEQTGALPEIYVRGQSGTENLTSGYFGSNVYLNQVNTLSYSPFNEYKLFYGYNTSLKNAANLILGRDRNATGYWKGELAEILIFDEVLTDDRKETILQYLRHKYTPPADLGADITIDYGFEDTTITAYEPWFQAYRWNDSSTDSVLTVSNTGTYSVTVNEIFDFQSIDSIIITYPAITYPVVSRDTTICLGDTLLWNTFLGEDYSYTWSNTIDDTTTIAITEQGTYSVTVTDSLGNFITSDTITVSIDSFPVKNSLGPDRAVCEGQAITLTENSGEITSWLWSDTSTGQSINIYSEGEYIVTVSNSAGCKTVDSIYLAISGTSPIVAFSADTICFGDSTTFLNLSAIPDPDSIKTYFWNFGDASTSDLTNPKHLYSQADTFLVSLTATSNNGCTNFSTDTVIVKQIPDAFFGIQYGYTQCTGTNIYFIDSSSSVSGIDTYYWDFDNGDSDNTQNPSYSYSSEGIYVPKLTITDNNNCSNTDSVSIEIFNQLSSAEQCKLNTPLNDLVGAFSDSVLFTWESSLNAYQYEFHFASDPDFTTDYYSEFTSDTSLRYALPDTGTWYWKVDAYNLCNQATNSEIFSFENINPLLISSLQLWLRADEDIILQDTTVLQWSDKTTGVRNAIQSTIEYQPTLTSTILNNKPAILFDGTNDYLLIDSSLSIESMFAVFNWSGNKTVFPAYNGLITEQTGSLPEIYIRSVSGTENLTSGYFGTNVYLNQVNTLSFSPFNEYKLFYGYNTSVKEAANLILGRDRNATGYWKGELAEILIFDEILTDEQIEMLQQYLRYKYTPPVDLGADITIDYSFKDTLLSVQAWHIENTWSTGETDSAIVITESMSGTYYVECTDIFSFESSDTITVTYPLTNTINDTSICYGDTVTWNLQMGNDYSYLWNTGDTTEVIDIVETGYYYATITDSLSYSRILDSVYVYANKFATEASLGEDRALCTNNALELTVGYDDAQEYLWSDGSVNSYYIISGAEQIHVTVTNSIGCMATDTVNISVKGTAPSADFTFEDICFGDSTIFTSLSYSNDDAGIASTAWYINNDTLYGETIKYVFDSVKDYAVTMYIATDSACTDETSYTVDIHPLPEAYFLPVQVCEGQTTKFYSQSTVDDGSSLSLTWYVDDESYTDNYLYYSFKNTGYDTITLKVTSAYGCKDSTENEIWIKDKPTASFFYSTPCFGETIKFSNTSTTKTYNRIIDYSWTFDDATTSSGASPSVDFSTTGNHTAQLVVSTLNGCKDTLTETINVGEKPSAEILIVGQCILDSILFVDKSSSETVPIDEWLWTIDDNEYTSNNVSCIFSEAGEYPVELIVTTETGCKDTVDDILSVYDNAVADFSFSPTFGGAPLTVTFENLSENASEYLWDFSDGSTDTEFEPVHIFEYTGDYTIMLTATSDNDCSDSVSKVLSTSSANYSINIIDVQYTTEGEYIYLIIYVVNSSTLPIYTMDIIYNDSNTEIREEWTGTLESGEGAYIELSSGIRIYDDEYPEYICVEANLVTETDGAVFASQDTCISLAEELWIGDIYPNPATENIMLEIASPGDVEVNITIIDETGKLIDVLYNDIMEKELYQINYDIGTLKAGTYYCKIVYSDQVKTLSFIIQNEQE